MRREVKRYLYDIKTSIDSINEFIGKDTDLSHYQNDKLLRRAVERELEIIGEAMNRIMKIAPETEIENARQIIDTRNWVIHAYDSVDNILIWGIITMHLPKLKEEVEFLLKQ